jgi:L-iditol 2-dehydrogenase
MGDLTLPTSSRAAVITNFGSELEVRDLPIPELEAGALLVKVEAGTVCGSDVHVWDGSLHAGGVRPIVLPVVPGHEMVGIVVTMNGEDIGYTGGGTVSVGDRIVFTQGRCSSCYHCSVAGQPNLCSNRRNYGTNCEGFPYLVGGFAEYCYVYPTSQKILVPHDVKSEWASAGSCSLRTIINAFEQLGRVEPWQTVVVQGTGPLGLFATALAKCSGAQRIVVVGAPDSRLELARAWGATDLVSVLEHPEPQARVDEVLALTRGQGAEIVMEWSGARTAFSEGIDMVRRGGRFLVGGQVGPHQVQFQPAKILKNHLTVIGSMSGTESHYWKAMQFLSKRQHDFDFDRIISNRYGLDRIADALRGMQNLTEIKPVIIPGLR